MAWDQLNHDFPIPRLPGRPKKIPDAASPGEVVDAGCLLRGESI
jgi:hypothetical protein